MPRPLSFCNSLRSAILCAMRAMLQLILLRVLQSAHHLATSLGCQLHYVMFAGRNFLEDLLDEQAWSLCVPLNQLAGTSAGRLVLVTVVIKKWVETKYLD